MAKSRVEYEIRGKDSSKKATDSAKNNLSSLEKATSKIGDAIKGAFAVGAIVGFAKAIAGAAREAVQAFAVQEQAERALEAALRATGDASESSSRQLKQLASELQGVTTFGDEATLQAAALLTQLGGLSSELTAKSLPAVQDFASAMGMDLNAAASLVGKSIGSSTNALSRYGIEIDNSLTGQERLDAILGQINNKFGGFSQAMADTASGSLVQFNNALGDLREVGGRAILEFLQPSIINLTRFTTEITLAITQARELSKVLNDQGGQAEDIEQLAAAIASLEDDIASYYKRGTDAALALAARDEIRLQSLKDQRAALQQVEYWTRMEEAAVTSLAKEEAEREKAAAEAELRNEQRKAQIRELYQQTNQGQIEFLESQIAIFESFADRGPMTIAILEMWGERLEELKNQTEGVVEEMDKLGSSFGGDVNRGIGGRTIASGTVGGGDAGGGAPAGGADIQSVTNDFSALNDVLGSTSGNLGDFVGVAMAADPLMAALAIVLGEVLEIMGPLIDDALQPVFDVVSQLAQIIAVLLMPTLVIFGEYLGHISNVLSAVLEHVMNIVSGFTSFMEDVINGIINFINSAIKAVNKLLPKKWRIDTIDNVDFDLPDTPSSLPADLSNNDSPTGGGGSTLSQGRLLTVNVQVNTEVIAGDAGIRDLALMIRREIRAAEALGI